MKSVGRRALKAALLLGCAGFAVTAGLAPATGAFAQTQAPPSATYTLPAQDLGAALTQLARQSGREIVFSADVVRGLRTAGVSGRGGFEPTLNALLAGTGLTWRVNAGGAVIVERGNGQADAGPGGATEIDDVVVTGEAAPAVVRERRTGDVAVDVLTSEDFDRYPATDVSDVILRMPGVSVTTRGSFAVVRGLAERYNPVLLDGFVMPSNDPERQMPPLDLFPTRLVDAIVMGKVFEPSLPATATGGSVSLRTPTLPNGRFVQYQFGLRADEGYFSGDDFYSTPYDGRGDLLGLGSGDRPGRPETPEDQVERWRSNDFHPVPSLSDYPIGLKLGFVAEDRIDLNTDGRAFGYSLSFGYDSSAGTESGREMALPGSDGGGGVYDESEQQVRLGLLGKIGFAFNDDHALGLSLFVSQEGVETATLSSGYGGGDGGFFIGGFYDNAQALTLLDIVDTRVVTEEFPCASTTECGIVHDVVRRYRETNLTDLTLTGEHRFRDGDTQVNWAAGHIKVTSDEPDVFYMRYVEYVDWPNARPPEGPLGRGYYVAGGHPGRQPTSYWREVEETTSTARFDVGHAFNLGWMDDIHLKAGLLWEDTERSHDERTLAILTTATAPTLQDLTDRFAGTSGQPAGNFLGSGGAPWGEAERGIEAAYVSLTLPLLSERRWAERLDLLIGARIEDYSFMSDGLGNVGNTTSHSAYLTLAPRINAAHGATVMPTGIGELIAQFPLDASFRAEHEDREVYPAVALTWSPIDRLNLRLSYTETVARPSFRETGSYFTRDEITDEWVHGNAFLLPSPVTNIDFRAEYFFPGTRDLIAISLFDKEIEQPIERVTTYVEGVSRTTISWANTPGTAHLRGVELEVAKGLGFLGERGDWFTVGANATWVEGGIDDYNPVPAMDWQPIVERGLADQPEWIANAYVTVAPADTGFSATLSYFAISDTLYSTSQYTQSTYVAQHDRLDLVVSQTIGTDWSVRFSASNLLDPDREFTTGGRYGEAVNGEWSEIEFGLGEAGERPVVRQWNDGRSFSLTLTREF